jgi:hypothetical protein
VLSTNKGLLAETTGAGAAVVELVVAGAQAVASAAAGRSVRAIFLEIGVMSGRRGERKALGGMRVAGNVPPGLARKRAR